MNSDEKIKEIRNAVDIVSVISSYIPLVKKGKNYFGVCPFHDDTNPSMSVSSEKQIYKCFSCGASGNVFNFIMDYEKVDFKEALNILSKISGIPLDNTYVSKPRKYEKFYKIYDLSCKYYQNNLSCEDGAVAKNYLYQRKIDDELIKVFKIGLSKIGNNLTELLTKKDYSMKELELIGLTSNNRDLYQNRIMFPLFNITGEVVGFSGRIYNSKSDSKYINTKETPIFKKGELLYNYHLAKEEARKEKKLIIVEGFMDVIRLYSVGIKNVVALMGTALTKEQITLIKRVSNNIIISLDGDSPGKKACYNVGEALEEAGFDVSVITLKENLDPDEFIIKYGKEEYQKLLDNPYSYNEFKVNYLKEGKDLTKIEDQTVYINNVLDSLKNEEDEIKIELILKKITLEFGIDIDILRKKLQNIKKCSKIEAFKKVEVKKVSKDKYQKATYGILYYMLYNKECRKIYEKQLNYLPDETSRYLANEIIYMFKQDDNLLLADFITTLTDKPELKKLLDEVLNYEQDLSNLGCFNEYITDIYGYNKNQEIKRLKDLMKKEVDPEKQALLAEKIRLVKIGS
ncbi:MAG: DNA primase [bacterium]|nr:DNA primase [bacterium]